MNSVRQISTSAKICCIGIASTIFLQKFGIPLSGDLQGPVLIPVITALLVYLMVTGRATIHPQDFVLFGLFGTAVMVSNLFNATFSLPSVMLLLVLSFLLTIRIPFTRADYEYVLGFFQKCMILVVLIELGQYAAQIVGQDMPILDTYVPDSLLMHYFNYVQPLFWGVNISKPNGVFMLEPSYLSQFLGLALAVEAALFKRKPVIFLFFIAIVLAVSGTGLILALVVLVTMMYKHPRRMTVPVVIILVMGATVAYMTGLIDIFVARMAEFSDPNASGSLRFIAPYERMYEALTNDLSTFLLGSGAGFLDRERGFAFSSPSKIWVEEGFISFLFFVAWCASIFFRNRGLPLLSVVLFMEYLLVAGGGLMQPCVVFACLFLASDSVAYEPSRSPLMRAAQQRRFENSPPQGAR